MENLERPQFVVLTGHLDDQSLPDIIRTLRVQRKSGRLQVEYPDTPGSFFFEDGQMVAAQLGALRDVEALYAALELRGASFNFNPLVRPPERSIDKQGQKFIQDLVEVPRREALSEIKLAREELTTPPPLAAGSQPAPLQLMPVPAELMAPVVERLLAVEAAIISTSRRFSRERLIYTLIISFLVGLILVTALQFAYGPFFAGPAVATAPVNKEQTGAARNNEPAPPTAAPTNAQPAPTQAQPVEANATAAGDGQKTGADAAARTEYVVRVRLRVKNGQVTGARVLNSRASASESEARALKLAMQHQYPANFTGGDTLKITVER
ncbi:MAG: DUF4388 domain-containing protein [Pyrinomonadaceae bacterium]